MVVEEKKETNEEAMARMRSVRHTLGSGRPVFRIKPLDDRVAVLPEEEKQKIGNILLPDTAKERPTRGVVVAKGPNATELNLGDIVIYRRYAGDGVELPGGDLRVISQKEIIASISVD